ncbi:MAG TPA: hypothetical protein VE616_04715 [Candidatus Udaeobacter sp.]|jgi:hypothetical protein|nr:hypothetical protein [Candidatus Udaeobacter sp.]
MARRVFIMPLFLFILVWSAAGQEPYPIRAHCCGAKPDGHTEMKSVRLSNVAERSIPINSPENASNTLDLICRTVRVSLI